jgi:threonine/homoserine/homoserine lactone efflux protein
VSTAFLVTTLLVVATPGTGVVYTRAAGLSQGRRAGIIAAFGCTLGIVPHLIATVTGVAALLQSSALAFQVVRYLGVGYLLYLAWATLRDRNTIVVAADGTAARSPGRLISSAIAVNLLNPKLTMFFLAFLPQFVDPDGPSPVARTVTLGGIFMGLTFVVFAGYGTFAAAMREHLIARPRAMTWLRRLFAASFVGLGVRLALVER